MLLSRRFRAFFFCAFCAAGLLIGCGGDAPPQLPSKTAKTPPRAVVSPAAGASADTAGYVFDIPALMELTADQIKAKLGKPVSDGQESIDEEVNSLRYQRRGYDLSIDYEVKSRRIATYYFNPHKLVKEPAALLQAINATQNDKRYSVQYLSEGNGVYNGVLITPKNARVQDRFGNWVPRDSVL